MSHRTPAQLDLIRRGDDLIRRARLARLIRARDREAEIDAIENVITSSVPHHVVIGALERHGCTDLSWQFDRSTHLENPIACGGFGNVFRGTLWLDTRVAIKILRVHGSDLSPGGHRKRAARELYIWSKCKHRNVVELMGLVELDSSIGMVSRWEDNGNLAHYLSRNPLTDRCHLSTGICAGVSYLHENGIVHGDIKGLNVLVAQDETPMLMDFGTAHIRDNALQFQEDQQSPGPSIEMAVNQKQHMKSPTDAFVKDLANTVSTDGDSNLITPTLVFTQTKTGLKYSPRWAAPEIFSEEVTTTASDTYSLGMTILETLTSTVPFAGTPDHVLFKRIAIDKKTPIRPEKEIPEKSMCGNKLWDLLTQCWSYDAKDRPSASLVWNEVSDEPNYCRNTEGHGGRTGAGGAGGAGLSARRNRNGHPPENQWFGCRAHCPC